MHGISKRSCIRSGAEKRLSLVDPISGRHNYRLKLTTLIFLAILLTIVEVATSPAYAQSNSSPQISAESFALKKKVSKKKKKPSKKVKKKKTKKKKKKTPTPTPTATPVTSPNYIDGPPPTQTPTTTATPAGNPDRDLYANNDSQPTPTATATASQTPPPFPSLTPTTSATPTPPDTGDSANGGTSSGVGSTTIPGTNFSVGFTFGGSQIALDGFQLAPGPAQPYNVKNFVLKTRFTPYLQVAFYIRKSTNDSTQAMSLEFKLCNNPLYYPDPAAVVNNVVPSQKLVGPIEFHISGGARLSSMHPQLSPFTQVTSSAAGTITYRLLLPHIDNPKNLAAPDPSRLADGACIADGFVIDGKNNSAPAPTFFDLAPLFPPNPGQTLWSAIDPLFPAPTTAYLSDWANASLYFETKTTKAWDPALNNGFGGWANLTADGPLYFAPVDGVVTDEHQTGFHWDWSYARASGHYLATGNITGLLAAMRGIYTVFNRPQHFDGLNADSTKVSFVDGRPALSIYGTSDLGRPHSGAQYALPADAHGWLGVEVQHGSFRAGSEIAMLTGLPMIWEETRYYGELAKAMLRSIDPKPAPGAEGFCNTPRGYVSLLEAAFRAWKIDSNYDMSYPIQVIENFISVFHNMPFAPGANSSQWIDNYNVGFNGTFADVATWAKPLLTSPVGQPLFAMTNNKWSICPSGPCDVSVVMEEGRFANIGLLVGLIFNRPTMLAMALEMLDWWSTPGQGYYVAGQQEGIKWFVNAADPSIFGDPTGVDPKAYGNHGYAYAIANAMYFGGTMIKSGVLPSSIPGTAFSVNGDTLLVLANKIKSESKAYDIGPNNYAPAVVYGWYPFP
ncbi:MAG: hypothetical protein K1X79_13130 [Oligoflexia bacterium]|nr:hypothetical protein [Oligoflexia bacterium]